MSKYFAGNPRPALRKVSLELDRGAVLALLGESGSGKTTLLRLVAGFEQPASGTIALAGSLISSPHSTTPPEERGVGMVFQDTALLPHLTMLQNVAFGLRRLPERERRRRAEQTLELVHIADVKDRYPHEVSGGQAQRAAIGRALAPRPALLLFDEPFNNLDPVLKWEMLHELRAVLSETAATALFVTHDRDEAFTVADSIALLHRGRIAQVGEAEALYHVPASAFVARYLGAVNLVPVWRRGATWMSAFGELAEAAPFRHAGADAVSVRPWQLRIDRVDIAPVDRTAARGNSELGVSGTIRGTRFMGEYRELRVRMEDVSGLRDLTVHASTECRYRAGDRVRIRLSQAAGGG
ncbi:MAG: ABC transporter ATP-binding protein [Spirochaetaceae bacterium]|nr:ABC transporter ATP-binding protein [Spirochaetaceae bacterium]